LIKNISEVETAPKIALTPIYEVDVMDPDSILYRIYKTPTKEELDDKEEVVGVFVDFECEECGSKEWEEKTTTFSTDISCKVGDCQTVSSWVPPSYFFTILDSNKEWSWKLDYHYTVKLDLDTEKTSIISSASKYDDSITPPSFEDWIEVDRLQKEKKAKKWKSPLEKLHKIFCGRFCEDPILRERWKSSLTKTELEEEEDIEVFVDFKCEDCGSNEWELNLNQEVICKVWDCQIVSSWAPLHNAPYFAQKKKQLDKAYVSNWLGLVSSKKISSSKKNDNFDRVGILTSQNQGHPFSFISSVDLNKEGKIIINEKGKKEMKYFVKSSIINNKEKNQKEYYHEGNIRDLNRAIFRIIQDTNRKGTKGLNDWMCFGLHSYLRTVLKCPWALDVWLKNNHVVIDNLRKKHFFEAPIEIVKMAKESVDLLNTPSSIKSYFCMSIIESMLLNLEVFNYLKLNESNKHLVKIRAFETLEKAINGITKQGRFLDLKAFIKNFCLLHYEIKNESKIVILKSLDGIECKMPLFWIPILLSIHTACKVLGISHNGTLETLINHEIKWLPPVVSSSKKLLDSWKCFE